MTKAATAARSTVTKVAPKGSAKAAPKPVVVEEPEEESEEEEDDFDGSENDEEDDEDDVVDSEDEEGDEEDDDEDEEDDEESDDEEEDDEEDDEDADDNENNEDVVDDLVYDVYNLLASNYHAVRILEGENKEQVLQDHAQRAAQLLMKKYVSRLLHLLHCLYMLTDSFFYSQQNICLPNGAF